MIAANCAPRPPVRSQKYSRCERVSIVEPDFEDGEEERALEVDRALEPADRLRMRRVEDVERLDDEGPPEHLGRERGAAHPEQDAVVELLGRGVGERVQLVDVVTRPA